MFKYNTNFYPTPKHLINKMLQGIDFRKISSILEPSAGDGAIVEGLLEKLKSREGRHYITPGKVFDIDCIEIDQNLRYILQGKGYRVVHDNFLTYDNFKKYSLIVANFPFSEGNSHLLKALEMIKGGGSLVCLINAETIKNPYNNIRKTLIRKLNELNANIEYLQDEFIESERTTDVEVALIKVNIENKDTEDSIILNKLKQEEKCSSSNESMKNKLIDGDFIKGIIQQYQLEAKAGLNLIQEFNKLTPLMLKSFKQSSPDSILALSINDYQHKNGCFQSNEFELSNDYIKKLRYKYWEALFNSDKFGALLTSNLQQQYSQKIADLQDYDFSYYNIKEIQIQMSQSMTKGVEDTILALFDEFSYRHSWDKDSKNIHLFNGWKTNKSWKINKKVIVLLSAWSWTGSFELSNKVYYKLRDIEKVFDYLDGGKTEYSDLKLILKEAEENKTTKQISTKYFKVNFYGKGTAHITFLNEDLLKKFNVFGCMKKNFLPPSYGKCVYSEMTKEAKDIIDDFEGKESYCKTMDNLDYYLYNPSKSLMISGS